MEMAMLSYSTQSRGVLLIADLRGFKFTLISPADIKRGVTMWAGAFPCKLKRVVVISPGGTVHMLLKMVLAFIPKKIQNRVVILDPMEAMVELVLEVNKAVLPTTLGGEVDMDHEWPSIVHDLRHSKCNQ